MSKVVYINQYKIEKQYKVAGNDFIYYPKLDNIEKPIKRKWTAKEYGKELMRLNTNLINNRRC